MGVTCQQLSGGPGVLEASKSRRFDEFYGFLGGETNQWSPAVYHNLNRVETPEDPDYHFMNDIATKSIEWMRFQQALTPDKPFFTYFAPGAVHGRYT